MEAFSDTYLATLAARDHDRQAFGRLVMRHQSTVRRFFRNHTLGDVQLSDDLAQDTFVKAYLHIGDFKGTAAFSTWLLRIAYNVFYDYIRVRRTTSTPPSPHGRLPTVTAARCGWTSMTPWHD